VRDEREVLRRITGILEGLLEVLVWVDSTLKVTLVSGLPLLKV
jgi:hypothetical protein